MQSHVASVMTDQTLGAPTGQRELPALLIPSYQDPALSAAATGIPSYGSPYIPYMPEPAHMSPVETATEVATAVVTSVITVPVTCKRYTPSALAPLWFGCQWHSRD